MRRGADADDRGVEIPEAVLPTWAAISEPNPQNRTASCATTSRCVFATDAAIRSVSSGTSVRGSTTSTLIPAPSSSCAARSAWGTCAPSATTVASVPSRAMRPTPSSIP